MKKKFVPALALLAVLTTAAQAQDAAKTYLRLGIGYGFGTAPTTTYQISGTKIEATTLSLGKGLQTQLAGGYFFSEHLGAELAIGYLSGADNSTKSTFVVPNPDPMLTTSGTQTVDSRGNLFSIQPSLVLRAGGEKIVPYARMGFILGSAKAVTNTKTSIFSATGTTKTEEEMEMTGSMAFGFAGALGATYKLNDRFGIYAEASLQQLTWSPEKAELTESKVNGQSQLSALTTADKEFEFVESLAFDDPQGPLSAERDPNKASKLPEYRLPFNNIGLSLGVRYSF